MSEVAAALIHRRAGFTTAVPALLVASLLLCSATDAQTMSRTEGTQEEEVTRDAGERELAAEGARSVHTSSAPRRKSGGFTVAAFTGGARTLDAQLVIRQPALGTRLTFRDVHFDGRSSDPPLYYGLRGGYFFRHQPSVGVEAEFIHLKVYSDPARRVRTAGVLRGARFDAELPLGDIVQRYSISHGVNLLIFNIAARRFFTAADETGRPRFILTARAGAGPTTPHTESTIEGVSQEQYEFGRVGFQAAGGAEVRLVGKLYALGEYKFTRTRQRGVWRTARQSRCCARTTAHSA